MSKVRIKSKLAAKKIHPPEPLVKDPEMKEKYARLQADKYRIQGWFIRASWKNKAKFITKAIRSINSIGTLRNIVQALHPETKDILYAGAQTTKYSYDIVPNDDDRCLEEIELNENIEMHLKLLNSLFNEGDKLDILLHLIKIGGTELANIAAAEANKLGSIFDFIMGMHMKYMQEGADNLKYTSRLAKLISKELSQNSNILPLIDEYNAYLTFAQQKNTKTENKIDRHSETRESKVFTTLLRQMKNKQTIWDKEIKKLIHMARTGLPERTKMLVGDKADTDELQSLPLWINRQIVNLLDDESKQNLGQVNHYWKYTTEEVEHEQSVRKNLDNIIRKTETRLMNMKLPGQRFTFSAKKQGAKSVEIKTSIKGSKRTRTADSDKLLRKKKDFKESIYKYIEKIPFTRIPFKGLYNDMLIRTIYMYDRSIDCNRRWIAATENTFIAFYNIITGAKTPIILSGHSLVVTCIAFFPKSFRIVSGSLDTTVRTWNLWKKKVIEIFRHNQGIISVSASEEYVVSCSQDYVIRIFKQLHGGICVKLIQGNYWTPTKVLLSEDNIVYWSTTVGAIVMYSITDENMNKSIDFAHKSEVIYIGKFGKLIASVGNDNYVRLWNTNLQYDTCITEFLHDNHIHSMVITCLTLITACANGALYFWHIENGLLFRKIQVNFVDMPMISLKCQEYYNHVKIVCNNESHITVLEFGMKVGRRINKKYLYHDISLHPMNESKKISETKRRLFKMHITKCSLSQIRERDNYKRYTYSTDAIIKEPLIGDSAADS